MTKILSIVSYKIFPPEVGGQKSIALFNEYLARVMSLVCVTVKDNDPAYAKGYRLLNILSSGASRYINIFYFFTIQKIIRSERVSHVLLEHPYYGWLGILLKKFTGVELIIRSQNIEAQRWKSLGKWWWRILFYYEKFTHQAAGYSFFIQEEDMAFAIKHYQLDASKCFTVTYGITWNRPPSPEVVNHAKQTVRQLHKISEDKCILFFNGSFDYPPNLQALQSIISHINPLLKRIPGFAYTIIIAGKHLPEELMKQSHDNIIFAGFVEDIRRYFTGSDVFLNPVVHGGGIKTKLVEALGYNLNTVSTQNGAIGVDQRWCNGKLLICADNDWQQFARLVEEASKTKATIPDLYYEHFYWENIVKKAISFIEHA